MDMGHPSWRIWIVFFSLLSPECITVEGQTNNRFDPSEGSGREADSCRRQFLAVDEAARDEQANLPGGRSARLGSKCNHTQWKEVREKFIQDAWDHKYDNFNSYLEKQRIVSMGSPYNYFEDLCIACSDEPMLECDGGTGTCTCWRQYVKETLPDNDEMRCRIKLGDFCTVESLYTGCVQHAYCDKETQHCACTASSADSSNCNDAFTLEPPTQSSIVGLILWIFLVL